MSLLSKNIYIFIVVLMLFKNKAIQLSYNFNNILLSFMTELWLGSVNSKVKLL